MSGRPLIIIVALTAMWVIIAACSSADTAGLDPAADVAAPDTTAAEVPAPIQTLPTTQATPRPRHRPRRRR